MNRLNYLENEHFHSIEKGCKIIPDVVKTYSSTGREAGSINASYCETHYVKICKCGWEWEWHYGVYSKRMP